MIITMNEPTNPDINIYLSLLKRVQSILIDNILIISAMFIIAGILSNYENVPDWVRITSFIMLVGVYEPLLMSTGGTIGNRLMKLQVRQYADETKRINIFQSYSRYFVKILLGWLSFITIHMNKHKRGIHDLAAGSVMIQKK